MSGNSLPSNFDILIGLVDGDEYPVSVLSSPAGGTEEPVMVRMPIDDRLRAQLDDMEQGYSNREDLKAFGRRLREWLLPPGSVRELYERSLELARELDPPRLRLRLHVEPPELAALPWEFTWDEGLDDFLVFHPRVTLVRFQGPIEPSEPIACPIPVPILVLIANLRPPEERLRAAGEFRSLVGALQRLLADGKARLDVLYSGPAEERVEIEASIAEQPGRPLVGRPVVRLLDGSASVDAMRAALRQGHRVLHYIGHGTSHPVWDGMLLLDDGEGLESETPAEVLRRELWGSSVRVVVLNACKTATPGTARSLLGLAQGLVEGRVPAVVAMQYPIADSSAVYFTPALYGALADGLPLDAAVTEGRKALAARLLEEYDFGIPVLYMHAPDGVLWEVGAEDSVFDMIPPLVHEAPPAVRRWFVDRDRERARFKKMLAGEDLTQVLAVWAENGIGKTWLRHQLGVEAGEQQVPAFDFDFVEGQAFDERGLLKQAAGTLGPGYFAGLANELRKAERQRVDLTDPEVWQRRGKDLREEFFRELAGLGRARGAALLFDSYELADKDARDWIKDQLLKRLGEGKLPGVRVVLVGTKRLPRSDYQGAQVAELTLDDWSADQVRQYLREARGKAVSEASVTAIHEQTGGSPSQVAWVAEALNGHPEPLDREEVQEILARGPLAREPEGQLLRLAAIPEWFDADLLAALSGRAAVPDSEMEDLRRYSFMEEISGRYRLAAGARQELLKAWDEKPEELLEMHRRAAAHLEARAAAVVDRRLRPELGRQAMGHWLVAQEATGRERLVSLFQEAERDHRLSECELLLRRAEAVPGIGALTQTWLEYLKGRLALAREDTKVASERFKAVLQQAESGSELQALAEWGMGQIAAEAGDWEGATERYDKSLQTLTGLENEVRRGQVMLSLGDVYLRQAKALGGLIQPRLLEQDRGRFTLRSLPAAFVALAFVAYARAVRDWRLPPLKYGLNYSNWTLARLLLHAEQHFRQAQDCLTSAGATELIPDAQRKLAETYHLLGWWRDAHRIFNELLGDESVRGSSYRQAQVSLGLAASELSAGRTGQAINDAIRRLTQCLITFEDHRDEDARAETLAVLGRARLENNEFPLGLARMEESLGISARLGDRLGTGIALHALRGWLERSRPTAEQVAEAQALIAGTRDKVYFPRVVDRSAQKVERAVSYGLVAVLVLFLILSGWGLLVPVNEIFQPANLGRLVAWLLLSAFVFLVLLGGLSLFLIRRGAQRAPEPEPLDRIVTSQDAIRRFDYLDTEQVCIPWGEVQAVVSEDRVLWRRPLALLSRFYIFFGREDPLRIRATVRWYRALREDVEDHLAAERVQPVRLNLDARVPLGAALLLSLVLLVLGAAVVYVVIPLPGPAELAAWLGTTLLFLGMMALLLGLAWWLVHLFLWIPYHLAPRSRRPLIAGLVGLGVVAAGWWLRWRYPFHPIRNWLEWTLIPLGHLLLMTAPLWVLTARQRSALGAPRDGPAFSLWLRGIALPLLLAAAGLTGLLVRNEWLPYLPLYRALTCYKEEAYECTIRSASRALQLNRDMVDGYYLRAEARIETKEYAEAVSDLSYLLDSGRATLAHYRWLRAQAYHSLDTPEDDYRACVDLRVALDTRRYGLSAGTRRKAQAALEEWECTTILTNGEE